MNHKKNRHETNRPELPGRVLCTLWMLAIYIVGRRLPLVGLGRAVHPPAGWSAESFLDLVIGGDRSRASVFALGLAPMMISSILIWVVMSVRRAVTRSRFSLVRMRFVQHGLTAVFAVIQAVLLTGGLTFVPSALLPAAALRWVAVAELTAGALLLDLLGDFSRDHGLGGLSPLMLVNLASSLAQTFLNRPARELLLPGLCSAAAAAVALVMENAEFRIPVQRISIHTIYSDKNYLAIKYSPAGMMPVMFAASIFLLLQQLMGAVLPRSAGESQLSLQQPAGIALYIGVLWLLTVLLALLMVDPFQLSDQMLKSGDSICGICLGRPTRRYLVRAVTGLSLLSAAVMTLCIGTSLLLSALGLVAADLVLLPSTAMLTVSMLATLWRDLYTAITFDAYRPFL